MVFCASSRRLASVLVWRCLLFSILLLPTAPARGQGETLPISLPEELLPELEAVLEHALSAAPSVQLANLELARAEANYLVHRAALLPNVAVSSSYNVSNQRRDGDVRDSTDQGFFYQVGVTQPLFHWGARRAERDLGELARLVEMHRVEEARARLATTLRTQYLDLIIRKLNLRNQRFHHGLSMQSADAAEQRYRAGNISEAEIINTRLAREDANLALRRSEHELETFLRIFRHVSGDAGFTVERIADAMPSPLLAPEQLEQRFTSLTPEAVQDLPAAEVHQLQLQQAQKRYDIEKVRLRPKVSLVASHGLVNLTTATTATIEQTAVVTTTAGIAVNWTIFDGLAARGARLAALAAKRSGERQYQSFLETTYNDLQRLQSEIEMTAQGLDLAERRYVLVQEALERARADFAAGRVSQATLDAHLGQANATEAAVAGARSQLFARWLDYVGLAGLDPRRDVPVPPAAD